MKYLILFEDFEKYKIYFIINCKDLNIYEKSINDIEDIIKNKVNRTFNIISIKNTYKQPYLCVSIENNINGYSLGYNPIIEFQTGNIEIGSDWYDERNYKFGGYINCNKKDVDDFIYEFKMNNKYNV